MADDFMLLAEPGMGRSGLEYVGRNANGLELLASAERRKTTDYLMTDLRVR